ncbi:MULTISPECIES: lipoprotein LpqH [Tsukamurella]|uniref:Lipoprotein LpqH n=2 Tax=Tsukamurella TaxID=2060 RepID=A0A5C5S0Q1_9ACTN|nr:MULTISPECIES: lipoprotein LpqH [Tsukamurella]NMD58091.1 lipoprotein LpqH [Tsukamurella columbiensis]TWS28005.1 hypothetical protein FK530_15020 [Tsukamurella conjunctivitidis]
MNRWGSPVVVACVLALAGCSSSIGGTPVRDPGATAASDTSSSGVSAGGSAKRAGTATVQLDGAVPAGAERIVMQCDEGAGTLIATAGDPLKSPEYSPIITMTTGATPATETVMFSVRVGVLLGQKPFTTTRDGASYVIGGRASGITGNVDDGTLAQVDRRFEIRLTC